MNWYKLFYWIAISEKLQQFMLSIAIVATVLLGISLIGIFIVRGNMAEHANGESTSGKIWLGSLKPLKKTMIWLGSIFWFFYIATPSRSDTIMIIAGGAVGTFISSDSSTKALPSEVTGFLRAKIQQLTLEAKEDLGIIDDRTKKINELKGLDKDEIIDKLRKDTNLLK